MGNDDLELRVFIAVVMVKRWSEKNYNASSLRSTFATDTAVILLLVAMILALTLRLIICEFFAPS